MLGFRSRNSGEDLYFVNSESQAAAVVGGMEPATGRHSVIERLEYCQSSLCDMGNIWAYPDSVSRVRPPKTTMPKTLAALPNSQYATTLSLVSGKNRLFAFSLLIVLLKDASGEGCRAGKTSETAVECCRPLDLKARRKVDRGRIFGAFLGAAAVPRAAWQVKNCFDSLGAAFRSKGRD